MYLKINDFNILRICRSAGSISCLFVGVVKVRGKIPDISYLTFFL